MRVCFVFRSERDRYSIERVFNAIINELVRCEVCEITRYVWDETKTWLGNIIAMRRLNCDIYHVTGDINHVVIGLFGKKLISTIHDIGSLRDYGLLKKIIYYIFWIYLPLKLSHVTTTVSEFTKSKIRELPFLQNVQIIVLSNPVSLSYSGPIPENPKNDTFTVLFLGTGKHKNIGIGIKIAKNLNYKIIVVGKKTEEFELLKNSEVDYEWLENLSDREVLNCYLRSHVLLFLSLHEGFGLPIIEANLLGLPVVASKIEPLLTVGGKSVLYCDPFDEIQIQSVLESLRTNDKLYNETVENGRINASRFDVGLIANNYFILYNSIVNEN